MYKVSVSSLVSVFWKHVKTVLGWEGFSFVFTSSVAIGVLSMDMFPIARIAFAFSAFALLLKLASSSRDHFSNQAWKVTGQCVSFVITLVYGLGVFYLVSRQEAKHAHQPIPDFVEWLAPSRNYAGGLPWRWILVSLIVGFLASSIFSVSRHRKALLLNDGKSERDGPQRCLTHQELLERIEALPPDERVRALRAALDRYGSTLYRKELDAAASVANNARAEELKRELNEGNQKYSEIVAEKRIVEAALREKLTTLGTEMDSLTTKLGNAETRNAELNGRQDQNERLISELQNKVQRYETPQIHFTSTSKNVPIPASSDQEQEQRQELKFRFVDFRLIEIYLVVRSEIVIDDLRVQIEELKVRDEIYKNVPLRAAEDETYQQVFVIRPGDEQLFHVATFNQSNGLYTFYTALPDFDASPSFEHFQRGMEFNIVARGSGTVPFKRIGRFHCMRRRPPIPGAEGPVFVGMDFSLLLKDDSPKPERLGS